MLLRSCCPLFNPVHLRGEKKFKDNYSHELHQIGSKYYLKLSQALQSINIYIVFEQC
jgi:hypothetical protein